MTRRLPALVLLLLLAACRKAGGPPDAAAPAAPAPLSFAKDRTDLLFSYVDAEGKLRDVARAEQVPEDRRRMVLVRDLSRRAEELEADRYVYVADLTREENGAWTAAVVSRYGVDRSIREGDFGPLEDLGDAGAARVVLYGTSWCGACAQARRWLQERGVPFVDRDIERDERAAAQMRRRMKQAGIPFGGVPVLDVGGELMLGFDAGRLERLLQGT